MKNAEKTHSRVRGIFMFILLQLLPCPDTIPAPPAQDTEMIYRPNVLSLSV